jgi:flagella basal body P-ring formation protein FlgA
MSKGKWICLGLMGFLAFSVSLAATENHFNKPLSEKVSEIFDLDTAYVKVEIIKCNLSQFITEYDSLHVTSLSDSEPNGLMPFLVIIFKDNKEIEKGQIRVRIRRYADVLVTNDRIKQHDIISPDKVNIEKMEITVLFEKPLTSVAELAGMWSKRNIAKGQILSTGLLEEIPAITSGQGVSILYKISGLEATAAGVALENGYPSKTIKIRNNQSGKIINCTIMEDGTVQAPVL